MMKFQNTFLYFLLLLGFSAFSQTIIIDDNVVYKKGLYKDFEEFKFNRPSIPFDFKIDSFEYKSLEMYTKGDNHFTYRILANKNEAKKIGPVFGFCDGKKIYINESMPLLGEKSDFELLHSVGLYSFFKQYMFVQGELGAQNTSTILYKSLNVNNGDVTVLMQEDLNVIFANDSVLLKQFSAEKDPKSVIEKYISNYSQKHKIDGVYCRDTKMTRQQADSFIVRQTFDSTDTKYYNRILSKLKTNPAFTDGKLDKSYYDNGKLKSIGFTTRCNFDPNDHFLYSVGVWKLFYETGPLKEIIEYSILSKQLSRTCFDKEGRIITK